ncbi:MAG: HYExAFE family protein [Phycisphaeraceae bacterium]|nr:MAG: HYExAFE family protein [Phycisphaeraceae bacterium]
MAQRRHHYEHAFEAYLRARKVPYVAVDEAKKAILPDGAPLEVRVVDADGAGKPAALKSFDFVIYGHGTNLLVEVKGRKIARRALAITSPASATTRGRLETWVTADDIESLTAWGRLFGPEFTPAFLFVYWCDEQPPDALFEEVFEHRGRWYALRAITLDEYRSAMKVRSLRWRTVHLPAAAFDRLSRPFAPARETSHASLADPPPGPPVLDPL